MPGALPPGWRWWWWRCCWPRFPRSSSSGGYCCGRCSIASPTGLTRLVTAAAFALTHLALDPDAAVAVPALFVMGVVLAALVQRRGRLGPAVVTHVGFNLLGVVGLLAS